MTGQRQKVALVTGAARGIGLASRANVTRADQETRKRCLKERAAVPEGTLPALGRAPK